MPPESHELLAHADFVRALARSLLLDEHKAADITQQAWLAALDKPPAEGIPLRAWLSRVTRNLSAKLRLGEQRRVRREWTVALPDRAPSTREVVEREETRRRVVEAVLALKEPYRTTILLRFYEDLPPSKVADVEGLPVETVKTRLKRGLTELRRKLDGLHGGDRNAWCLALGPVAGLKLLSSGEAAGGTGAALFGSLLTPARMKLAMLAIAVLGISIGMWQVVRLSLVEERQEGGWMLEDSLETRDAKSRSRSGDESVATAFLEEGDPVRVAVMPSARAFLAGRVTDRPTGAPVKAFHVNLWHEESPWVWKGAANERIMDEGGRFHLQLKEGGSYFLLIRSARHRPLAVNELLVPEKKGLAGLHLKLDPGFSVKGRVVEHRTGRPVPGVTVLPASGSPNSYMARTIEKTAYGTDAYMEWILFARPECCVHAVTGEDGRFTLSGLEGKEVRISALPAELAGNTLTVNPRDGREIEFRLGEGARIFGRALSDEERPLEGVLIGLWDFVTRPLVTDREGRYRTPPLSTGEVALSAAPPLVEDEDFRISSWWNREEKLEGFPFSPETKHVRLAGQDLEVDFGPDPDHVTWRGTFYDNEGRPVPHGMVSVQGRRRDMGFLDRNARCDVHGRFEIRKLHPGSYQLNLSLTPNTRSYTSLGEILLDQPGVMEKDVRLFGAVIRGTVFEASTGSPLHRKDCLVRARARRDSKTFTAYLDEEGRFSLLGLPPGTYTLTVVGTGVVKQSIEGLEIAEGQVLQDLRIPVHYGGNLTLESLPGDPFGIHHFMILQQEGADTPYFSGQPDFGSFSPSFLRSSMSMTLPPGRWTAHFEEPSLGIAIREFSLRAGQSVYLRLDRSEYEHEGRRVDVEGRVVHSDGRPAGNLSLELSAGDGAFEKALRRLTASTDEGGCFRLEGLSAGRWEPRIRLHAPVGGEILLSLPDLKIPDGASDPFPCELVLPSATLRAGLVNETTGLPVPHDTPWRFRLDDAATGRTVMEMKKEGTGSRLAIRHVPAGAYRLLLQAAPYENLTMEGITVAEDADVDLGSVRLHPAGILVLKVEGASGAPLNGVASAVTGGEGEEENRPERIDLPRYRPTPGGYLQCYHMPAPGAVHIIAGSPGFLYQERTVAVPRGETVEVLLVLEPDPYWKPRF